jgi:RecA/RadA recombinase
MLQIKGITEAKADKFYEAATKTEGSAFCTGMEIMEKRKSVKMITTGSKNWDQLLRGGIESQSITEAFGEFRSGKTQLSHTLAVTAQLPVKSGGGAGKILYIDTENTFRPDRICSIAERFDLNPDEVLNNIVVGRAYTVDNLNSMIMQAGGYMV